MILIVYNKSDDYIMMEDYKDLFLIAEIMNDDNYIVFNPNLLTNLAVSLVEAAEAKTIKIPK